MNALLIAGTDTGVGKTVVTMALAAYWQRYCATRRLGIFKPVQCGAGNDRDRFPEGDRSLYHTLLGQQQSIEQINPVYFSAPLAPPIAAAREGKTIRLELIWQQFEQLTQQNEFVLVESFGGLGSPLNRETTMADLAWDWRISAVLVVPVHPGTLAQVTANVALATQARLHLKGIILNCVQPCSNEAIEDWADVNLIQSLTNKPVLGCVPHLTDPTDLDKLTQVAATLELERLLPIL